MQKQNTPPAPFTSPESEVQGGLYPAPRIPEKLEIAGLVPTLDEALGAVRRDVLWKLDLLQLSICWVRLVDSVMRVTNVPASAIVLRRHRVTHAVAGARALLARAFCELAGDRTLAILWLSLLLPWSKLTIRNRVQEFIPTDDLARVFVAYWELRDLPVDQAAVRAAMKALLPD